MTRCPKCSKELNDGAKFCNRCGAQIFETIFCPDCGKQISTEYAFCQYCGAAITGMSAGEPSAVVPARKKELPKTGIIFGGIGAAVIAVIVIVIFLFSGSGRKTENNYAFYLKDREIFFTDLKKDNAAWQLTSRLVDMADVDNEDLAGTSYALGLCTSMSEDGKYIFFPDKVNDSNYNFCYREAARPEAETIKIDSDVQLYAVNASASIVTYLKEEGSLYQYKIGEDSKDKIAGDVSDFKVSDDGEKIAYTNFDNSIYLKCAGKEKEKLVSDISAFEYVTEDFTTVYYIKDDSLYKQQEGKDKVKIASDISDICKIYDSGEIYYLTGGGEESLLADHVIDDMKDVDAFMEEPVFPGYPQSPDYPYWGEYDSDAAYDAACKAYDEAHKAWEAECERIAIEYDDAWNAYLEKELRDELRTKLKEETIDLSVCSLCFYDGTKETVIADAFVGGGNFFEHDAASDTPVICYKVCGLSSLEKVKLSEIEDIYDFESLVEAELLSSSERYIAVKGTATVIEQEKEADYFRINASGTMVYYIDDIPYEKNYGELCRISISDGVVGKPEVFDHDVHAGSGDFINDDEFGYYKDYKDGKGELYIGKNRIDYDVKAYSVKADSNSGKVFYYTDYNDEKWYGTLKIYDGEGTAKIADDVYSFTVIPGGEALYLYDYSMERYKGELYEWSGGETRKLDDDVVCILPFFESKYRTIW